MRSGDKNSVVSIYETVETVDPDYNTPVYGPSLWKQDVFCKVTPRRGREVEIQGQIAYESYIRFEFEFYDVEDISADMYLVLDGVAYDIKAIMPDLALKKYTTVDCVTRPVPDERS